MANPDILRAFDMLAGAASDELRKSREFQINQSQRLQALAQMQQQQDREFKIEKGKLDVMREELNLRKQKQQFEQSGDLAERDSKIGELKRQNDFLKTQGDLLKLKNEISGAAAQSVLDAEKQLNEAFKAGAPEEQLDEMQRYVSFLAKKNMGIDYMTQDVDYTAARNNNPNQELTPFERSYQTAKGANAAKEDIQFGKIEPLVNQVEQEFLALDPASGGIGARLEQFARSASAELGLEPDVKAYKDVVSAIAVQTARALGDVGNIAVAERKINEKLLPKASDTKEIGLQKVRVFKRLVQAIRNRDINGIQSTLDDAGIKYGGGKQEGGNFQSINADTTKQQTFNTQDYVNSLGF